MNPENKNTNEMQTKDNLSYTEIMLWSASTWTKTEPCKMMHVANQQQLHSHTNYRQ